MSNPEIARRCRVCGASVRANMQFCPQCGQAMIKPKVSVHSMPDGEELPRSAKANVNDRAKRSNLTPEQKSEPPSNIAGPASSTNELLAPDPSPVASESTAGSVGRQRRSARQPLYAENEDNGLLPRVEKFRQASVDMLDEAADDPSLRFVLVSVMLFLCFLLIFLASTVFN